MLKLVEDVDDDDADVRRIANIIIRGCNQRAGSKNSYDVRLSQDNATETSSPLLLQLLSALCSKLDHTNAAILIGNIITSTITNKPTTLQIVIGLLMREKAIIEQCHEFGITCTYDEVLRFRSSAAYAASKEKALQGLLDNGVGFIQSVADNFDASISSPNGLKSTHALALLLTQAQETHQMI